MLVALKLQVLGLLPGVRAVFRVAGEIDTGNLGRTVTDLVFMVTRQGRWLRVWCTPGWDRIVLIVTFLRRNSSVLANDELRDTRQLSEATADLG